MLEPLYELQYEPTQNNEQAIQVEIHTAKGLRTLQVRRPLSIEGREQ